MQSSSTMKSQMNSMKNCQHFMIGKGRQHNMLYCIIVVVCEYPELRYMVYRGITYFES